MTAPVARAVLISFAGLPGTGKTTIAKHLSLTTGAVYLRVDEIDAAIWAIDPDRDIGPESYHIAASLAASNLMLGHQVDCRLREPLGHHPPDFHRSGHAQPGWIFWVLRPIAPTP